jgi:hypothetical protein
MRRWGWDAVNAALIGLIGVVVGALLTGFASLWVEEKKRQRSAAVAAYLIADELATSYGRIESALDANPMQWWLGDLPTRAWQEHLKDLGFKASADSLQDLANAYIIIDRLNVDRGSDELPAKLVTELQTADLPAIKIVKDNLCTTAKSLSVNPKLRGLRRRSSQVAAALIFVVALIAVIVPHPDVNSTTMASVVESWFGNHSFASCDPHGVDWSCNVLQLSGSRNACGLETSIASTGTSAARVVTAAVASGNSTTSSAPEVLGEACTDTVVDHINLSTTANLVVGLPQRPAEIERARASGAILTKPKPEQRPIAAFWGTIRNLLHIGA